MCAMHVCNYMMATKRDACEEPNGGSEDGEP